MGDILAPLANFSIYYLLTLFGFLLAYIGLGGRLRKGGDIRRGAKKTAMIILGIISIVAGVTLSWLEKAPASSKATPDVLAQLVALKKTGAVLPIMTSKNQYLTGDIIQFEVEVPQDGFLVLLYLDAKLKKSKVFPNLHESDNRVLAGKQTIPSKKSGITLRADDTKGETRVFAFFSPHRFDIDRLLKDTTSDNLFILSPDTQSKSKGIQVEVEKPEFYAGELRFDIH